MTRTLPTTANVQQAMAQVLAEAATTGRRATISAVERRLGLPHATFYRNFADLIQQFQQQTSPPNTTAAPANGNGQDGPAETIRRLRSENEDMPNAPDLCRSDQATHYPQRGTRGPASPPGIRHDPCSTAALRADNGQRQTPLITPTEARVCCGRRARCMTGRRPASLRQICAPEIPRYSLRLRSLL